MAPKQLTLEEITSIFGEMAIQRGKVGANAYTPEDIAARIRSAYIEHMCIPELSIYDIVARKIDGEMTERAKILGKGHARCELSYDKWYPGDA